MASKHYYIISPSTTYEVSDVKEFWRELYTLADGRRIYKHDYGNVIYYELDPFNPLGMIDTGVILK